MLALYYNDAFWPLQTINWTINRSDAHVSYSYQAFCKHCALFTEEHSEYLAALWIRMTLEVSTRL